jgi:uncharacterized protein YyaL (SSP411 family)
MAIRWGEWGEAAFARARAEGKPVLLSLTASWCHGCHRMEEETWEAPGIDAVVEAAAVPVRVDSDARPDVHGRYHLGGLPTTAMLTAQGDFIRGGTFFSPPQLLAFLESGLADFRAGRRPGPRTRPAPGPPPRLVEAVVARLIQRADLAHGGFGAAPKLPETEALTLLLRHWRARGDGAGERILRPSLDAIAERLADPVAGGFFRYAAAEDWSGPHTEKVAADQAALIRLFLEAHVALGEPRYLAVARSALAHARRRLADPDGRVFASVAADPAYHSRLAAERLREAEGGADRLRGETAGRGESPAGGEAPPVDEPPVDCRRFSDAAAGMLSAGLLAWSHTGEDPGFATEFMGAASGGMIPHRLDAPGSPSGLLRDQAMGLRAAVDAYRLRGSGEALRWAERVAAWSLEHLWDEPAGAFRDAPPAAPGEPPLPPMLPLLANGEMALALAELSDHAGRPELRELAGRVVRSLAAEAVRSPAGAGLALAAQRLESQPPEADLEGDPADPRARALARVVVAALGPTAVVRWRGGAAASLALCVRDVCLPPLDDPGDLLRSLVELELAPAGLEVPL